MEAGKKGENGSKTCIGEKSYSKKSQREGKNKGMGKRGGK